jgi:hypothetical protein
LANTFFCPKLASGLKKFEQTLRGGQKNFKFRSHFFRKSFKIGDFFEPSFFIRKNFPDKDPLWGLSGHPFFQSFFKERKKFDQGEALGKSQKSGIITNLQQ